LFSKNKNVGCPFESIALFEHQFIASKGFNVGIITSIAPTDFSKFLSLKLFPETLRLQAGSGLFFPDY
jgi:hypothetical protein